jgi:hypothetical protein
MNIKNVVAAAIAAKKSNSVSVKEIVRLLTTVINNPMSVEDVNQMINEGLANGEIVKWKGRGGSLRNAGPLPAMAKWGSKTGRSTKVQIKDKAIREKLAEIEEI